MTTNTTGLVERSLVTEVREYCNTSSKIPDESALAAHFGVSRTKLRETLACLEHEGAITRKPRVGIQRNVELPPAHSRIDLQVDYLSTLAAAGYQGRVHVASADIEPANAEAADRLGVDVDTPILSMRKVWFADDVPAMTAIDRLPVPDDLSVADLDLRASVFSLVHQLNGEPSKWEIMHPSATVATEHVARLLALEPGAPCLTMRTLGVSENGRRLFDSLEHHVPDVIDYGLVRTIVQPRPASKGG